MTIYILCGLIVLYLILVFFRTIRNKNQIEGFSQSIPFSQKDNSTLYDQFYVSIYDELVYDPNKVEHEADEIIRVTGINSQSKILDVGSGPGHHVNEFQKRGFNINGLDDSLAMVKYAKKQYPNSHFKKGSILNPYVYDSNTYSHIISLYFTVYYFKDKSKFFGICHRLLKPGGYLVIHLVDSKNFDPMISLANPLLLVSPQSVAKERITNSSIKFNNFQYKSNFTIQDGIGKFEEKFIDDKTKNIRKNVHTLFMDSQKTIIKAATDRGFKLEGTIDLVPIQYEYQYLYVLSKQN